MSDVDEITGAQAQLVLAVMKNTAGVIDFEKVAAEIGVANGEAARKRFKRFLEKENIDVLIKGNNIGAETIEAGSSSIAKTPKPATAKKDGKRTPKRKADASASEGGDGDKEANVEEKNEARDQAEATGSPSPLKKTKKGIAKKNEKPSEPKTPKAKKTLAKEKAIGNNHGEAADGVENRDSERQVVVTTDHVKDEDGNMDVGATADGQAEDVEAKAEEHA